MKIKKTVLALGGAFMLFSTTLNAQEQPWSFGVKAGGSMSWLSGLEKLAPAKIGTQDKINKASGGLMLAGGLTAGYAFHENVGVGLEVLYAGLGGELETSNKLANDATDEQKKANKPIKTQIYSHNLVVPVMLKLFPMGCDPDEGILTVELGPQFVFPFSVSVQKSKMDNKGVATDGLEEWKDADDNDKAFDKSGQVKPMTIDGVVGIGYEFPEIGLTLEGRYHYGFMDFFKSDSEAKKYRKDKMNFEENKNVSNQYASLSVGYNFARLLMD
jgi:hypothetical protein